MLTHTHFTVLITLPVTVDLWAFAVPHPQRRAGGRRHRLQSTVARMTQRSGRVSAFADTSRVAGTVAACRATGCKAGCGRWLRSRVWAGRYRVHPPRARDGLRRRRLAPRWQCRSRCRRRLGDAALSAPTPPPPTCQVTPSGNSAPYRGTRIRVNFGRAGFETTD
jgi:hypothetical protein